MPIWLKLRTLLGLPSTSMKGGTSLGTRAIAPTKLQ